MNDMGTIERAVEQTNEPVYGPVVLDREAFRLACAFISEAQAQYVKQELSREEESLTRRYSTVRQ